MMNFHNSRISLVIYRYSQARLYFLFADKQKVSNFNLEESLVSTLTKVEVASYNFFKDWRIKIPSPTM